MTGSENEMKLFVGADPLAPLAAGEVVDAAVEKADAVVRKAIAETREKALDMEAQAALTQEIILGEFLPDVREAHRLALGLVSGNADQTSVDATSVEELFGTEAGLRAYLTGFEAMDPTKEYPFPQIVFPVTAIVQHKEQDHYFDEFGGGYGMLRRFMFTPSFRSSVQMPTLIDPRVRNLNELTE